jgi:ABC-type multidrug transport system fused ATPase/permease subunit
LDWQNRRIFMEIFWQKKEFQEGYYQLMRRLFRFEDKVQNIDVDFSKPWYRVLFSRKWSFLLMIFSESVQAIFEAFFPLFIGYSITQTQYVYILYIILIYILLEVLNRYVLYIWYLATGDVQSSIMEGSQRYFLTVDPVYHSTKSTGQITSKLQAGGREFLMMLNTIFFNFLPIVVTYFTVSLAMFKFSLVLGVIAVGFFVVISIVSVILRYFHSKSLLKPWIKYRDRYSANQVENLQQNAVIRSSFATVEQVEKTRDIIQKAIGVRNTSNQGNSMMVFVIRLLYISSVAVVAYFTLEMVQTGTLSAVLATTLLLTYINGSSQVLRLGDLISQITESAGNIKDMFEFINNFGKQTYPVIPSAKIHNTDTFK